ncbi:tRNA-binding protein [Roseivirga misakiensis]|uniref:tRNA-binding protein n=1 Tax=Roseivirga misakiensis TaxID=1563681 RepID=A0A1E5T827_9BACT|nr:tRNA-binding protein [Roseivirga misakiensis]OEK07467.1 tRNA-binding protein [Roseivirga misakiensis]
MTGLIDWKDFEKVSIRVGTIIKAETYAEARNPAYILHVDLGEKLGVKKSSAQITALYQPEDLLGKQVVCITNFPPKQIGKIMSEVLVTGFPNSDGQVVLCTPDTKVPNGVKLF